MLQFVDQCNIYTFAGSLDAGTRQSVAVLTSLVVSGITFDAISFKNACTAHEQWKIFSELTSHFHSITSASDGICIEPRWHSP